MHSIPEREYLASCCVIARDAGRLIMTYAGRFEKRHKEDKSPVTDADLAANRLIVEALSRLTPDIPVIAEEDEEMGHAEHLRFWLVDPLDGTRSFVRGEDEFTVNIGLVENRRPRLGIIAWPARDTLYWAGGEGAFRRIGDGEAAAIRTRAPEGGPVVVRSQSHPSKATAAYLETIQPRDIIGMSSAIKFCLVAEGSADIYPRFGRTMEWDTAAGHAIVEAAGGRVETAEGESLLYGKPGFENPAFIAYGK